MWDFTATPKMTVSEGRDMKAASQATSRVRGIYKTVEIDSQYRVRVHDKIFADRSVRDGVLANDAFDAVLERRSIAICRNAGP